MLTSGIKFSMNLTKILLLPLNSRVEKSVLFLWKAGHSRTFRSLISVVLWLACRKHIQCSWFFLGCPWVSVLPQGRHAQPDIPSVFMPSLFRILQTRSWIFISVLRWFCPEKSSQPSKGCPLHSWSGILYIFYRPCVVKVTLGHAMNTGELRSWSDLSFGAMLVFAVIGRPSTPGLQLRLTFRSAVAFLAKHLSSWNSGLVSGCVRPRSLYCI